MDKYSWILVWLLILTHCFYFRDTPCNFPEKQNAAAAEDTNASNCFNVYSIVDVTHESDKHCRNGILKSVASKELSKYANADKGRETTNVSSKWVTSKLPYVSATDDNSRIVEKDECFYGIGIFIAVVTMFYISHSFQTSLQLKHILSDNLFLCYGSQGVLHLFFVLRYWKFGLPVDCKNLMCDIATFSNFVLLSALSWSSIISSDLCMVKSYAIWSVKHISGSIRIGDKESFMLVTALVAVLFYCASMGMIYCMHALTYVLGYNHFFCAIQNSKSPLTFTFPVCLMIILNFGCFSKKMHLNRFGENSPDFGHYVFHARENNKTFFCLSVLYYLMWFFSAVVSILDLSWLWTLFIVIYQLSDFVLLFFRFSLSVVPSKSHDDEPAAVEPPVSCNHPRPCRHRINTMGA